MHDLLQSYLSEIDWSSGVTKDAIMRHLAGRDEALRTMVNAYVPEGSYHAAEDAITLIPEQAWQDVQGDTWRGPESELADDVPSHFTDGPASQ